MNRRGMTVGIILALVVAIAIIVLIFTGVFKGMFGDKILPIFKNLPRPGQIDQNKEVIGNVRYDIQTNTLQLYDGTTWDKMPASVEFESVGIVSEAELNSAFNEYYFDASERSDPKIYSFGDYRATAVGLTKSESSNPNLIFPGSTKLYERGATIVNVQRLDNNNILGAYYIASFNSFEYLPNDQVSPLENQQNIIIGRALEWRNSILSKPFALNGEEFCITMISDKYLNIDLVNPGACDAT